MSLILYAKKRKFGSFDVKYSVSYSLLDFGDVKTSHRLFSSSEPINFNIQEAKELAAKIRITQPTNKYLWKLNYWLCNCGGFTA